jgi:outer membrane protein
MVCAWPLRGLKYVVLIALIVSVASSATFAADAEKYPRGGSTRSDEQLTLPQAVSIAVTRNLRITDARLAVQEKEHQRREAYSDFFPSIDVSYAGTWYRYMQGGNVAAIAGTQPGRWAVRSDPTAPFALLTPEYPYRIDPFRFFTMTATMTQPIYTGGRLMNDYKYARLGVDYSALQYDLSIQDLTLDVNQAYYQLVQAQKLLEVAEQSIRSLEALRNQTLEFYKAGVVAKVDVLSTEGQLAQARIQRTQSLTDIQKQTAQLNFLLRYPQETPVKVVQDIAYRPNAYRIPEVYATAAGNRLEIRQANISVDQALALVKVAKADLLPTISAAAQGSRLNDDWNTFDPEGTNDWRIQGLLEWGFDIFRRRETVKEKRVGQARAFVAREQLVEQIMTDVKSAYSDMKRAESDISDNRKAVEFRTENFRINRERYKEQVATYIEVLDAQRQLAQAQGDYYISLIGYRINQAVLERQMGTLR